MKKGCIIVLIVLAVLFLLLAVSGGIAFVSLDNNFGIRLAPAISHEELAMDETRIRMVIKPELILPFLIDFIPEDVDIDTHGVEMQAILDQVVPREVALLVSGDMVARSMHVTFFANEKRGGPFICTLVNEDNPFEKVTQIAWTSLGLELYERGMLVAEGDLPVPAAVEAELLETWPTRSLQQVATVQGNNHIELVLDNSNGDILMFVAAVAEAAGNSWEAVLEEQMASMVTGVIKSIGVARLIANMIDTDTAEITLDITADSDSGAGLQFLISGIALPQLKNLLKEEYGLVLEGDSMWDEEKGAVLGTYTLTGLDTFIRQQIEDDQV
ncbi:MAG: hypothetical protein KAH38_07685 [Candidatus Hydrogenedentes bacterium]|nr:hypothetical protein [Candidatus Hydrogenedentota bacterium]